MQSAYHFFYKQAGYSVAPGETKHEGRARGARELANAERYASNIRMQFHWSIDPDIDSSEFDDSGDPWQLWQCVARDEAGNIVASLHGIDFGRDGEPWSDPYKRVVEAELASEYMARIVSEAERIKADQSFIRSASATLRARKTS